MGLARETRKKMRTFRLTDANFDRLQHLCEELTCSESDIVNHLLEGAERKLRKKRIESSEQSVSQRLSR